VTTARDEMPIRGALTSEDAIDWALRRWADQRMRVLSPREAITVREVVPGSRVWRVTADVELLR